MPKIPTAWLAALAVAIWANPVGAAMSDKEKGDLAPVVAAAKVTLEQGLLTSKKNGKPVSAKFEIENGKPQLSVYIVKDGSKYSEVIVDHTSSSVWWQRPQPGFQNS